PTRHDREVRPKKSPDAEESTLTEPSDGGTGAQTDMPVSFRRLPWDRGVPSWPPREGLFPGHRRDIETLKNRAGAAAPAPVEHAPSAGAGPAGRWAELGRRTEPAAANPSDDSDRSALRR